MGVPLRYADVAMGTDAAVRLARDVILVLLTLLALETGFWTGLRYEDVRVERVFIPVHVPDRLFQNLGGTR